MTKRHHLITLALYTLITFILTYPVPWQLATHIAGFEGEDNLQWRWYLWWGPHAWLTLQQPISHVSLLFAPTGGEQPLYSITTLLPALAMPLTLAFGATISFNVMLLLGFILSGYTAYLLIYYLLPSGAGQDKFSARFCAALLAGLIFTFYPAHFGYATGTFLGQVSVYLLPLYLLALTRLTRANSPRISHYLLFITCCALLMLTWPLHVAYGVLPFTLAYGLRLLYQRHFHLLRPLALALFITGFLILPFYYPLLMSVLSGQQKHLGGETATLFSVDLLAFITPSNHHPILAPLGLLPHYTTKVLRDYNDIEERLAYLGVIPLLLALVGWLYYRRRLTMWLSLALIAMLLSLGPLLKVNGALYQLNVEGHVGYIVLPYALLRGLPILDWSAVLGRFNVITMLCLAIMAGHGAYVLMQNKTRLLLTSVLTLFILSEYVTLLPFPMQPDHVPTYYTHLAELGRTSPQKMIDLPLDQPHYNNYSMYYQTVHQQAILGGHFMRTPAGTEEMTDFVQALLSPVPVTNPVFNPPNDETRRAMLGQLGFTQIIARPWLMTSSTQLAYLQTWLGPFQAEDEVQVFQLSPNTDPMPPLTALLQGKAWQLTPESSQMVLTQTASMVVYVAAEIQPASLHLSLNAPTPDRYLNITLDGQPLSRLYLARETLQYHVPLSLTRGAHQLTLHPEEACRLACAPLNLSQLEVIPTQTLRLPANQPAAPIQLQGYELASTHLTSGQPMLLYLYWHSEQATDQNLSAFVQLLDPSGKPIAQADYVLGGWLYPTSAWSAGQATAMPTLFFIPPQTAPGDYQLQTGLYQTETGQRISAIELTHITIEK